MNSKQSNQAHYAVFGNVVIPRGFCRSCRGSSFIEDGKFACCGQSAPPVVELYKRESEPEQIRRTPRKPVKEQILQSQNYRCFYCDKTFGNAVFRRGKAIILQIQWEHLEPFSFSQNNEDENFAAACQICNGIKTDLIFQTIEEAQIYVRLKRESKGYADSLPDLPNASSIKNQASEEILFGEVPHSISRKDAESENKRTLLDQRSGAAARYKPVNRSQSNQKRRTSRAQNRKSASNPQKPVVVIPIEISQAFREFAARYGLSCVKLGSACGLSKSSAHRLITGTLPKSYFASIEVSIIENIEQFLILKGKNKPERTNEINLLSKPLPIDSEQIITVEQGFFVRYIFKDHTGRILQTIEIQG